MRDKKMVAEFNEWADRNKIHNCMRKGMWEAFKRDYAVRKFGEALRKAAFALVDEKQALLASLGRGGAAKRISPGGVACGLGAMDKEENPGTKKMREIFKGYPSKVGIEDTFCQAEAIYEKGKIVGLFLAWKPKKTNHILFGYSLCHPVDEFSWDKAVSVAIEKMTLPLDQYHKEMPEKIIQKWGCFYRKVRLSLGGGFTRVCYPFVTINCEFIRKSLPMWLQKELRLEKSWLEQETKQVDEGTVFLGYYTEAEFSKDGDVVFRNKLDKKPKTGAFFEVKCTTRRITE